MAFTTIGAIVQLFTDIKTALTNILAKFTDGNHVIKKIVESVSVIAVRSTDTKPTMASDWRGYCFETDTQKLYDWSGSAWTEVV